MLNYRVRRHIPAMKCGALDIPSATIDSSCTVLSCQVPITLIFGLTDEDAALPPAESMVVNGGELQSMPPHDSKALSQTESNPREYGEAMLTGPTLRMRVDNPKRRGKAPPFWSLGVQGRDRNAPAVLLGDLKGVFSHVKENTPFYCAAPCGTQGHSRPSAGQDLSCQRPDYAAGGVADRHHEQI